MNLFKKKKKNTKEVSQEEKEIYAILNQDTPFSVKENYKALRTNIIFSLKDSEKCKIVNIASANPSEGKTTTSINLAITFAETSSRVLLIDCDLRKPKIHRYANFENKAGLSNVLCGFSKLSEVIKHTEFGFDVITSGHIPPNPSELLASKEMENCLDELRKIYDFIFLDCPPINVVTDSLSVSSFCDGTIFVVKPFSTTKSSLAAAIAKYRFANQPIIGFIVNAVESKQSSYYKHNKYYTRGKHYYNYYNYSYRTYASYYNTDGSKGHRKSHSKTKKEDK